MSCMLTHQMLVRASTRSSNGGMGVHDNSPALAIRSNCLPLGDAHAMQPRYPAHCLQDSSRGRAAHD
jgi:hypothetical protein